VPRHLITQMRTWALDALGLAATVRDRARRAEGQRLGGLRRRDDLELLAQGFPPVRLQSGAPELVGRCRNRPVG
jgi:hypothetical protein